MFRLRLVFFIVKKFLESTHSRNSHVALFLLLAMYTLSSLRCSGPGKTAGNVLLFSVEHNTEQYKEWAPEYPSTPPLFRCRGPPL